MSALLAQATATFSYKDASVTLSCSSPEELLGALAKFGIASNDAKPASPPKVTPAAQPAGNASASTGTPAGAQGAANGSAAGGDAPKAITYNEVRDRVLALSKVSRDTAVNALKHFGVDHGNKLPLEQYGPFMVHTEPLLKGAAK
jgi:hypothetical protein